ncbi:DNA alkylation repair protein [Spirosoma soli]|uniref:DNA alkylation repair protein n=1 Tax=Spirosoma soli TaxID=1770529 RepID=A0ABW5M8Q5_9BACT
MTHLDVKNTLLALEQPERASFAAQFFQVKPGHYGEGDQFLGLSMPQQHAVAKQFLRLSPDETEQLVRDPYHECRMTGLLIWVYQVRSGGIRSGGIRSGGIRSGGIRSGGTRSGGTRMSSQANPGRAELADRYVANRRYVNNWDLVDSSSPAILGEYLLHTDRSILYELAEENHLWTQRIAMVATLAFIRKGQFSDTFALAEQFIQHKQHDLVDKAVGWMLREVGKRNPDALEEFLHDHIRQLPRTALRNAIYSLDPAKKRHYLEL